MAEQAQGVGVADEVAEAGKSGPSSPAVKRFRRLSESLTPHQKRALALLSEGKSIPDVANEIDVNRATVYRWMKTDKYFRAAYNAWQLEQRESCRLALFRCAQIAVKKIVTTVEYDKELAWKLAKELGLFGKPQLLSADPDQIEREIEIERLEEEARLDERQQSPLIVKAKAFPERDPSAIIPFIETSEVNQDTADQSPPSSVAEMEREDVLRKVKIGNIAASIVDKRSWVESVDVVTATKCDKTGESGTCPI